MRDPSESMAQTEILREFIDLQGEFAFQAPPDSLYLRPGLRRSIHGGMFAFAIDGPEPGVCVKSAFRAEEPEATALAKHHFVKAYPDIVGIYQQSPAAQLDTVGTRVVYDAGRELLSEDRRVIGGFVLMSANKTLNPRSEPYVASFVAMPLSDALRFAIRDEVLHGGDDKDKSWRTTLPGAATNQIDEARLQNYALHLMSGLFPPARRIHKTFGLRRRPK
jgi:hypothetical protein